MKYYTIKELKKILFDYEDNDIVFFDNLKFIKEDTYYNRLRKILSKKGYDIDEKKIKDFKLSILGIDNKKDDRPHAV